MCARKAALSALIALAPLVVLVAAPNVSPQQADAFAKKLAIISAQSTLATRAATVRRTSVSEDEVNSWFAYRAQPLLPQGMSEPQLTIVGNGRVMGTATLDLDTVAKQRRSSGILNPWNLVGGRVPVTVAGTLHTENGRGQFDVEETTVSGLPVPTSLLQELVAYYSRTPTAPQGIRLDDPFELPANIRQIEVGQGKAVVIQ
ncbi:MAG TPA: hypothetical protein VH436_02790 [Vicinamibacterales bacterium]|jgi:hypothetical protein